MNFSSINPQDGTVLFNFPEDGWERVARRIKAAVAGGKAWRETSLNARAAVLVRVAEALEAKADMLAEFMAMEMGKPITQGRAEALKCGWVCRYYAEHAEDFLAPDFVQTEARKSQVHYQPLGPIFAIMPWNFPLWQVFRFAAPALMAGNPVLLKHAPTVLQCAHALTDLVHTAGVPGDVFIHLVIGHETAKEVIAHPSVAGVTLTGSTRAGKAVAAWAGAHLKKCVLELGGSDPYLILDDADIALAAKVCAESRLLNAGQSCIAAKRFIVTPGAQTKFLEAFTAAMENAQMGHPLDEFTTLGPVARKDLRDTLHHQVVASLAQGARLICGGTVPQGPGWYYPPTVLNRVVPGMPAFDEELFGPVAAIIPARDEEDAIRLANQSVYGLGAAVFSRDVDRAWKLAVHRLEAGAVTINDFVRSDPRLPFGGIKQSGFGRELGRAGMREFVNIKTVVASH